MTNDPEANPAVFWGRGVLSPRTAHVRKTRHGKPVVDEVDGERVGFALCDCLLIADIDPDAEDVTRCSECAERLAIQESQRQAE